MNAGATAFHEPARQLEAWSQIKLGLRVETASPLRGLGGQNPGAAHNPTERVTDDQVQAVGIEAVMIQTGNVIMQFCSHFLGKNRVAQPLRGLDFLAGAGKCCGQIETKSARRRG